VPYTHACEDELVIASELQVRIGSDRIEEKKELKETKSTEIPNSLIVRST
jgi:hypothetical protein